MTVWSFRAEAPPSPLPLLPLVPAVPAPKPDPCAELPAQHSAASAADTDAFPVVAAESAAEGSGCRTSTAAASEADTRARCSSLHASERKNNNVDAFANTYIIVVPEH
jgi:hypothetical protein